MNTPNIRKYQTEYYRNKNDVYSFKNNSYISIHQRNKLKKVDISNINFNEKLKDSNSYLIVPVYQTLKAENYIKNFNYQPSINFIDNKKNQIEEKYFSKINLPMSVKSQSAINPKMVNKMKSNYKINSVGSNHRFYTDHVIDKFNNPILSNSNSNIYKNINSNIYSPERSPYMIRQVMDKNSFTIFNSNNMNNLYDKFKINKVKKIKYNDNNLENFDEEFNNSKKNRNTFENMINSIDCLDKKKFNITKSYKSIKNEKNSKLTKNLRSPNEISNLKKNYFKKIDISPYPSKDNLLKTKENGDNINNLFKSNIIENSNNNLFKKQNNLILNSIISNSVSHTNLLHNKALCILKRVIRKRIYNYFISIKDILYKEKNSYNNNNNFVSKNKVDKNLSKFVLQNIRNNTLDNGINYYKILNKKEYNTKLIKNKIKPKKGLETKYKELLNENLKLQNKNTLLKNKNCELIKKLSIIKEENKIISKNPSINKLINENIKLVKQLKNIYMKYLIKNKIKNINGILKYNLNLFERKVHYIYNQDEKRKNLLKNIINKKENEIHNILRKYFYLFYYKSQIQKSILQKEKLIHIFYNKENKIFSKKKQYFDKLYYNSLNQNKKNTKEIIFNNSDSNSEKRKRLLKIIININMENINNIILMRSVLKQWALRTKIINMKIMLVKEENNKNIINPIQNLIKNNGIKNIIINNFKKDNLIKGIKKLNNIFISYKNVDKLNKENQNKNIPNNEINDLNNNINRNENNKKENILYKIYEDKIKYKDNYWVIEEKEEEQTEDNGESISFKNEVEQIFDYNINDSNNKSMNG